MNAFFAAIPGIGNVLLVSLLFWLIFSILGVHLFAGKFYKCVDSNKDRIPSDTVANKTECLRYPGKYRWINSKVTFDNVFTGFLALLQVVCFKSSMKKNYIMHNYITHLRSNIDQRQISLCNINPFSVSKVMRVKDMITQHESLW